MTDYVLNKPIKTVIVNKSVWDYAMLLSGVFEQFRAIKTNYNQVFETLISSGGIGFGALSYNQIKIEENQAEVLIRINNKVAFNT